MEINNLKEIKYTYKFSFNLYSLLSLIVICNNVVSIYKINRLQSNLVKSSKISKEDIEDTNDIVLLDNSTNTK